MKLPNHVVKYTLAVLLLASLTTTQILSTTFAKYTTSSGPVSDSARVAKYDVTVTEVDEYGNTISSESDIYLDCANDAGTDTVTKYYKITNNSEVAVSVYQMRLYHAEGDKYNLPDYCSLTVTDNKGKSYTRSNAYSASSPYDWRKFYNLEYPLSPGESLTMTLTFTITNGANKTSIFDNPMRVQFIFNQID